MSKFDYQKLLSLGNHISEEYIPKYFPGFSISIYENSEETFYFQSEYLDREKSISFSRDTIFRVFSMTKPIVSTAAMQLFQKGKFNLDDPVNFFLPEWKNIKVYKSGSNGNFQVEEPKRDIQMVDLFTHTSGLTYGLQNQTPVDKEYARLGIENVVDSRGFDGSLTADEIIKLLAEIPLEFSPGDNYHYSLSIDILGFIVERISDMSLEDYLDENIFVPLGMTDTSFYLEDSKRSRLAPCYRWNEKKNYYEDLDKNNNPKIKDIDFLNKPSAFSGGAGLLSTMEDYQQFGSSILNSKLGKDSILVNQETANIMMRNHLPNSFDMPQLSKFPLAGEEYYRGVGYGLGGSVVTDSVKNINNSFDGDFGWGGAAGTLFFISPSNEYSAVFMTQVLESEENRRMSKDIRTFIKTSLKN